MQLFVYGGSGGPDCLDIGLLDMPFVQSRQTHGDTLPAEDHAAFQLHLAAHVEGPGLGKFFPESGDDLRVNTRSNENLRAV